MKTIVLGPPGTGKTHTLLNQVEDYLKNTDPDRIGYFAFTKKAANEAKSRAMDKFNYSEDDMMAGKINKEWKSLMAFQLNRARDWFRRSEEGVRWLSSSARWPVWPALRLYRGILDAIERLDYDVFNNRAYVSKWTKMVDVPLSFLISRSR